MSQPWAEKPLAELCEFRNGLWKGKKPPYVHVGVIRNTNFTADGSLDDSDIAFLEVEESQFAKRQLQYGDLILEKSGGGPKQPVGRVIAFEETGGRYSFSNFTSIIRVLDPSVLNFTYLHRLLHWYYISGVTEGMQRRSTGIRNLDFTAYKQLRVPLPPYPEQGRIVAILDEAFAAIATATANAEKNLANARKLFESQRKGFLEDVNNGWTEKELGELVTIKHGFAFKSDGFVDAGEHVLLTPGNFFEEGGYRDRGEKQKYYTGEIPDGFILSKGDLLVAMTEQAAGLLGSPLVVPESRRFLHNQRLGLVQPLPEVLWCAEFFYHVFNTRSFRMKIHAGASGVKVRHTSPKKMYRVKVRYPESVAGQQSVASQLSGMRNQCLIFASRCERKIALLVELKQSILHKAFSGELIAAPCKTIDRMPVAYAVE